MPDEEASYQQILDQRAAKFRDLELRELALKNALDHLTFQRRQLTEQQEQLCNLSQQFEAQLAALKEGAQAAGIETVRSTLQSIKPAQAKEQLSRMLENEELDEVVILLAEMPASSRAKIIGEFKTADDEEKLSELLRRIRQGAPEASLADRTGSQLEPDASTSPMPGRVPLMKSASKSLASMGRARRANTMNGGDKVKAPVGENSRVWAIRPPEDATLGGAVCFPEGSNELTAQHKATLRTAVEVIGGKPEKIEVGGHTSSRPLPADSPYRNHWDLAYARCVRVMEYLVQLGIDPKRIWIGVAADNEPVNLGSDPLLGKENSRVEVLMLDELAEDIEGTNEEKQQTFSTQAEHSEE